MKVWLLEWFCSDANSLLFEGLFTSSEKAISYVEDKYPREAGYTQEVDKDGDISLYWSEYYTPPNERRYYDHPAFEITQKEVF